MTSPTLRSSPIDLPLPHGRSGTNLLSEFLVDHLSHLQFKESIELPINDYLKDDTLPKVSTIDP
jgi:hypothetical protein